MKVKSKLFTLFLAVCLVLTSVISVSANAYNKQLESNLNYSLNVESYKEWIISQVNMKDSNSHEAQIFLNEFNNLTQDEQELFVSYISNSDLVLDILNSFFSGTPYTTFENGDIVILNNEMIQSDEMVIDIKSGLQYRIGTATRSVSILGIKVFEYTGEIRYSHDGYSIREISHGNIWISRNFLPLIDFSWDRESSYGVNTSIAHFLRYCTWSFVHEKFGLTYGTHQIEITGDIRNQTTFSVR